MIILVKYPDNMKKQILSFITCLAISIFLFTNCKKEDDNPPPPSKTNTQRMTQSPWKFSAATVSGVNVSGSLQTCQKDNILTFSTAITGSMDEGATKCNAGDPQVNPFTWNFANNETIVHISTVLFTGGISDFTLVSISDTQLVLSQVINSQTVVVTFIHL
jgi:hypothetical protein